MRRPFCDISGTKIGKEIIGATKSHKSVQNTTSTPDLDKTIIFIS
jgi:hypothetical protein